MKIRGYGYNELDRALRKSAGYTSRLLGDARSPRLDTLIALAEALAVRTEWLATGRGPMAAGSAGESTYAELESWEEAAEIEAKNRRVSPYAIAAVGRKPVMVGPEEVTPEFVRACASFWLAHVPEAERALEEEAAEPRGPGRKRRARTG